MAIRNGILQTAGRGHLLGALASFANQSVDQWCPVGHPANNGQLPAWNRWGAVASAQAIEGLAASIPNHCIDGWSYASRSLSAILAGDGHAARHLAYYAQLRAGLCILANLGVGIFNRTNFVVTSAGAIERLDEPPKDRRGRPRADGPGMGTHDVVWEALSAWASGVPTSRALLDLMKIRGSSLRECLDAIWPGIPATGAATSLIEAWGLDLKRGKDEHAYRNISSYSPQAMNPLAQSVPGALNFVRNFWAMFEPTSGASFDQLDRFMLRSLLLKQHRTVTNDQNYAAGAIATRYEELPPAIRSLTSVEFLTNAQQPRSPAFLQLANATTRPAQPTEMLARAFLLLRAATALTQNSLVESGVSYVTGDMRPWIDPIAVDRGFWPPAQPLSDPIDLWLDVELALLDFDESIDPEPTSLNDWMTRAAKGLPTIYEAERIGVWSLCK
ncbi:hypothetical protein [Mesorhizobium sp. AA23]|uniref:hypothetical protein n=1 Tax=Mesorhizobium sp. AA23 TaxID=1854058 RepID=UPI000ABB59E8|nr:hypothetical protein [Mesorhizobium sp. AA23]